MTKQAKKIEGMEGLTNEGQGNDELQNKVRNRTSKLGRVGSGGHLGC